LVEKFPTVLEKLPQVLGGIFLTHCTSERKCVKLLSEKVKVEDHDRVSCGGNRTLWVASISLIWVGHLKRI